MAETAALRRELLALYAATLRQIDGRHCTAQALRNARVTGAVHLVAIGKAAPAMAQGALDTAGDAIVSGLIVTKQGYRDAMLDDDSRLTQLEAEHPVPGPGSLAAGRALLDRLENTPDDARWLFLISGGASSLVEVLLHGVGLVDYQRANRWLLGSGWDIHRMNSVRRRLSCIKGGRLLRHLRGRSARCLLISDVPGDDPASIGSGLLVPPANTSVAVDALPEWLRDLLDRAPEDELPPQGSAALQIVASNALARQAAAATARARGLEVFSHDILLTGNTLEEARRCAIAARDGGSGLYLWGGETTLVLPERPGRGGRNQSFALAAAQELADCGDVALLAAGTDGSDGPTADAGALVDGGTLARGAAQGLDAARSLADADAGRFLEASGDLIQTGPTGTNVMDLVMALKD